MNPLDTFDASTFRLATPTHKVWDTVEYVGSLRELHGLYVITAKRQWAGNQVYDLNHPQTTALTLVGAREKSIKWTTTVRVHAWNSQCSHCLANITSENFATRCYTCDLVFTHEDHSWYMAENKQAVFGLPLL